MILPKASRRFLYAAVLGLFMYAVHWHQTHCFWRSEDLHEAELGPGFFKVVGAYKNSGAVKNEEMADVLKERGYQLTKESIAYGIYNNVRLITRRSTQPDCYIVQFGVDERALKLTAPQEEAEWIRVPIRKANEFCFTRDAAGYSGITVTRSLTSAEAESFPIIETSREDDYLTDAENLEQRRRRNARNAKGPYIIEDDFKIPVSKQTTQPVTELAMVDSVTKKYTAKIQVRGWGSSPVLWSAALWRIDGPDWREVPQIEIAVFKVADKSLQSIFRARTCNYISHQQLEIYWVADELLFLGSMGCDTKPTTAFMGYFPER
jgi:hypothetical protein